MMSKQINETGYRVIVEPKALELFWYRNFFGDSAAAERLKDLRSLADQIADQIKRHADSVGRIAVEAETEAVCSHCGSGWTEASTSYNGGCCDEDEVSNPENAPATASVEGWPMQTELSIALELLAEANGRIFTDAINGCKGQVSSVAISSEAYGDRATVTVFGSWRHALHGYSSIILGRALAHEGDAPALAIERARAAIAAAPLETDLDALLAATLGLTPANDAAPDVPAAEVA